ncbi:PQQ-binding-like beta-propeller repeat protein [bacterium]|nr:PQQ-binding-like beta-propeller repeat protein [bacterium]
MIKHTFLSTLGIVGFSCLLAEITPIKAESYAWPEFRGPGKQGHAIAANVPVKWSNTENLAWKVKTTVAGWASPVVATDTIILAGAKDLDGHLTLHVASHDLKDGSLIWETEVFRPDPALIKRRHQKNSYASSTPVLADGIIYAHFGHLGTCALDLESGKVIWKQVIEYQPVHGNGGSPVLVDDLLIFSVDGSKNPAVYALKASDGKIAWRTPRDSSARKKFSFSTPLVIEVKGHKQVVSPGSGMVGAYSVEDGTLLWQVRYGEGYSVIPKPVLSGGLLFMGTGYDRPKVLGIRVPKKIGDVTDSHIAWQTARSAPNTPSMIVVDGALYFVSDGGILTCADPQDGSVHWSERLGGNYSASPIAVGDHIYFVNEEGVVSVLKATEKEFKVISKNDLKERSLASPAAFSNVLLLRTNDHLWKITSTFKKQ